MDNENYSPEEKDILFRITDHIDQGNFFDARQLVIRLANKYPQHREECNNNIAIINSLMSNGNQISCKDDLVNMSGVKLIPNIFDNIIEKIITNKSKEPEKVQQVEFEEDTKQHKSIETDNPENIQTENRLSSANTSYNIQFTNYGVFPISQNDFQSFFQEVLGTSEIVYADPFHFDLGTEYIFSPSNTTKTVRPESCYLGFSKASIIDNGVRQNMCLECPACRSLFLLGGCGNCVTVHRGNFYCNYFDGGGMAR